MLAELHIRNFALIDRAEVHLHEGFNVLTGATGVGKSLIIDALELLLGGRASTELIRHGENEATVEGVFFITDADLRHAVAVAAGIDPLDEPEVILQRSVTRTGRNRCRINSSNVTVSALRDAGALLVDIHGQHEQQSLLQPQTQRDLLDAYGKLEPQREAFAKHFNEHRRAAAYYEELRATERQRRSELDFARFQLKEIEAAEIRTGEIEALEQEKNILANAEKIQFRINEAYAGLYESDDAAIIDKLAVFTRHLEEVAGLDPRLAAVVESCRDAAVKLEDAAFSLREYRDKWDFDPDRLEELERRLITIRKLQSKYGATEEDILALATQLRDRIAELSKADDDLQTLADDLKKLADGAMKLGKELTAGRKKAATKLAKAAEQELKSLGMEKTKFEIAVAPRELEHAGGDGLDEVEFLIAPNPGEPAMSLRKIASGGEISRIMLALKSILADSDKVPLLIFDEIDSNIGGRMGRPIGERMAAIARCHQVVCITHLPQIAACGEHQLRVVKQVRKNATFTVVEELTGEARLQEIAEMIGGKATSAVSLEQAREMLGGKRL